MRQDVTVNIQLKKTAMTFGHSLAEISVTFISCSDEMKSPINFFIFYGDSYIFINSKLPESSSISSIASLTPIRVCSENSGFCGFILWHITA